MAARIMFKANCLFYADKKSVINSLVVFNYIIFLSTLLLCDNLYLSFYTFATIATINIVIIFCKNYRKYFKILKYQLAYDLLLQDLINKIFYSSKIFLWCMIFMIVNTISSSFQPYFSYDWSKFFLINGLCVLIFLRFTAYISSLNNVQLDNIVCAVILFGALNVSYNLYLYCSYYIPKAYNLKDFFSIHFSPMYGLVPDHYPTTSSSFYAICFTSSIIIANQSQKKLNRNLFLLLSILYGVVLFITQSRASVIAAIFSIFTYLYFSLRLSKIHFIALAIFLIAAIAIAPGIIFDAVTRGDSHRFDVWSHFILYTANRIILGYGQRIQFMLELDDHGIVGHAHNLLISSLTRGGLGATLSLLMIMCLSINYAFHYYKKNRNFLPLSILITIFINGLFDFELLTFMPDWQWICIWFPLGIAIGCEIQIKNGAGLDKIT